MNDELLKALDKFEGNFERLALKQREMADEILQIKQRGVQMPDFSTGNASGSLGAQAAKAFEANRELFNKTRSVRFEVKAAADPVTTASGRRLVTGGVGAPGAMVIGFQNGLSQPPAAGTSAIEYSRYTGTQGAAAQQAAQGDTKAAVRPDHSLIVQPALTIAGYSVMSRQALNDSQELAKAVDVTLARSVNTALDVALVNGATDFVGGFEALATAYTSLLYTNLADAVSEGVATMQLAGFSPDLVGLNPASWLGITVAKGTANDHYLSGSYLGALPSEMRGLRVVLSPSVDAGKALLMDSSHSEMQVVENFAIEVGYIASQFVQNLVTLLGETRVIPIFRTVGSARLITPKA